jgi:hypothetical protein
VRIYTAWPAKKVAWMFYNIPEIYNESKKENTLHAHFIPELERNMMMGFCPVKTLKFK